MKIEKALILPIVYYGATIYAGGNEKVKKDMHILTNKMIKIALGLLKNTSTKIIRGLAEIPYINEKCEQLAIKRIIKTGGIENEEVKEVSKGIKKSI